MPLSDPRLRLVALWFRQSLRSPWLYACWLIMPALALNEFANAGPGRSGLTSLDRVDPAAFLSQGWILAVISLFGLPFVFLVQEWAVARIKHSGFPQILLTSDLSERTSRLAELAVLPLVALLILAPLFLVMPVAANVNGHHQGAANLLNGLAACAFVALPNILLALCYGLWCSNRRNRLLPLLGAALFPFVVGAAFGLAGALAGGKSLLGIALAEPSGTALFALLSERQDAAAFARPGPGALFLLALNRAWALALGALFARAYLRLPPFMEGGEGFIRLRLPTRLRRWAFVAATAFGAALLAASNLYSNFNKNLSLNAIEPTTSFLFDRGLPGLETSLYLVLVIVLVQSLWSDHESGFQTFRDMSLSGYRHRAAALLARALAYSLVFYAILVGVVILSFAVSPGHLDLHALLVHFAANSLPSALLIALAGSAASILAPNRVTGSILVVAVGGGLIWARLSLPSLAPLLDPLFPQPLRYSEGLERIVGSGALVPHLLWSLAGMAAAASLIVRAWPRLHRLQGALLSRRDRIATISLLAVALPAAVAGSVTAEERRTLIFAGSSAAQYEQAALRAGPENLWSIAAADIDGSWSDAGGLSLDGRLSLRGGGPLVVTWAVEPDEIGAVRIDGRPVRPRRLGPGLYRLGTPPGRETSLSFRLGLHDPAAARIDTRYAAPPTIPLPGVLSELFEGDPDRRAALGLGAFDRSLSRFRNPPNNVSRPLARLALRLSFPCGRTPILPQASTPGPAGGGRCTAPVDDPGVRLEAFAALSEGLETRRRPTRVGPLATLAPRRFAREHDRLARAAAAAMEDIGALMGDYSSRGMTVAAVADGELPGSALSKPGLILVSDSRTLVRLSPDSDGLDSLYPTLAHELMHQWYGHRVRPFAYRPGAIFINEYPAQFARSWAIRRRFGTRAYGRFLEGERVRLGYVYHFQAAREGPVVAASLDDEIYPKSSLIAYFLATHSSWDAQGAALRDFARRNAAGPVTAAALAEALLQPLEPRARRLARLMLFDDLEVGLGETGAAALTCAGRPCAPAGLELPVRTRGAVRWIPWARYRRMDGPLVGWL
jgi:hypothetical protein